MPKADNNMGAFLMNVSVVGWNTAFNLGEHTYGTQLKAVIGNTAIEFDGGVLPIKPESGGHIAFKTGIVAKARGSYLVTTGEYKKQSVNISSFITEHTPDNGVWPSS